MGDNRSDSQDSRAFGPVRQDLIVGRVWFRYWPLRAWGKVSANSRPITGD
jgi:signal peptidase I